MGTIWYPDGSHANYDEGHQRKAVSYNEGFVGLPKPEDAGYSKSYTNPGIIIINSRKISLPVLT